MTKELLAEEGLAVDDEGFEELMEQRPRGSRAAARAAAGAGGERPRGTTGARVRPRRRLPTRFVGYEATEAETVLACARARQRRAAGEARGEPLLPGGRRPGLGQRAGRDAVRRARAWWTSTALGDDQALALSRSRASSAPGEPATARRRRASAPRDDAQPHRHPPAARGAARAARHARAPGRLLRRARTSCASTSPTASGSRPTSWPRSSGS